jgi:hypothetical protein
MGAKYRFACQECAYSTVVSGGSDVGMSCRTCTIACMTCHELMDIVVSSEPWSSASLQLPKHPKCPLVPRARHKCMYWTHPAECPRCGYTMERGELMMLWD